MNKKRVARLDVRAGYDLWASSYDQNDNPLVALDERHTVDDYLTGVDDAGFEAIAAQEFRGDEQLVQAVPWATKYIGRPLLLVVEGARAA